MRLPVRSAIALLCLFPVGASAQAPALDASFTTTARKASSGVRIELTGLGGQALSSLTVLLPPAALMDPRGAAQCTVSPDVRATQGHAAACPAGSRVGEVAAQLAGDPPTEIFLSAWNVLGIAGEPLLNLESAGGPPYAWISADIGRRGIALSLEDGLPLEGLLAIVTASKVGKRAFIRTPASCPKKGWTIVVLVTLDGGAETRLSDRSPCKR